MTAMHASRSRHARVEDRALSFLSRFERQCSAGAIAGRMSGINVLRAFPAMSHERDPLAVQPVKNLWDELSYADHVIVAEFGGRMTELRRLRSVRQCRAAGSALVRRQANLAEMIGRRRTRAFLRRFNVLWFHFHDFAER